MKSVCIASAVLLLAGSQARADEHLLADLNNDGRVTLEEFQKHRRDALMAADRNHDGKISGEEWTQGAERLKLEMQRRDIDGWQVVGKGNLFAKLDTNKDGFVTPAEIDAYTAPRFARADLNHDGHVTEPEAEEVERQLGL